MHTGAVRSWPMTVLEPAQKSPDLVVAQKFGSQKAVSAEAENDSQRRVPSPGAFRAWHDEDCWPFCWGSRIRVNVVGRDRGLTLFLTLFSHDFKKRKCYWTIRNGR